MSEFSVEEKIELFDMIADHYYKRNFGTMLKADIDVMLFSAYMEHKLNKGEKYDDYTLSVELGLTENKVRSLKERKQLKYPYKQFDWKRAFVELIPTAKYNKSKELVQICIEDINLMKEVRHFLLENHYFDEHQLNSKLFQCNLDFFIEICQRLEEDNSYELSSEGKKKLKGLVRENGSDNSGFQGAIEKIISGNYKGGIKELLLTGSDMLVDSVLKETSLGNLTKDAIRSLANIIIKS